MTDVIEQVAAIITNPEGQVLVVEELDGIISLPGGAVEPTDTSFEQAIRRELSEELSLRLSPAKITELESLIEFTYDRPDSNRFGKIGRLHIFVVEIDNSDPPIASKDIASCTWLNIQQAKEILTFPHHQEMLDCL